MSMHVISALVASGVLFTTPPVLVSCRLPLARTVGRRCAEPVLCTPPAPDDADAPVESTPAVDNPEEVADGNPFVGEVTGGSDRRWVSNLIGEGAKKNGNAILLPIVLISFIPYFLPPDLLPPEIMALWGRR